MRNIKTVIFGMCFLVIWNVAVGAESSSFSAKPSGWLDVTRFGAVPDDKENDADAIQKAIAFATNQNGGTVYLPYGVYLIDKPLTIHASGIILTGDGRSTVLKSNGCKDAIIRSLSCNRKRKGAAPISLENVVIENMTINGVDKTVTGILAAGLTRGCVIRDMFITSCLDGIDLPSNWSLSVERNYITGCSGTGLKFGFGGEEPRRRHRKTAVANAFNVIGNTVTGCDYGIWWRGGNGWFLGGNTFEINKHNAYFQSTESGTITGNYFEGSKSDAPLLRLGHVHGQGIPKNLFIAGNMFWDRNPKVHAIQIDSLHSSHIMANRIDVRGKILNIPYKSDSERIHENKIFIGNPPEKSNSFGVSGQMAWDKDYLYICVGTKQWKRVPLEKW